MIIPVSFEERIFFVFWVSPSALFTLLLFNLAA
jgi:hypothetical protein